MPRQTTPTSSFPSFRKIAIGFIVLAAVLLIFIVYFSFAKATIILTLDQEAKTLSFDLSVSDINIASDLVGEIISQETEITQKFTVQNYKEEPGIAKGKIRIINNHTRNQPLIRTTRFLSPQGILFRLEKTVSVPAGKELVADVYADQAGATGNIQPTRFTIPGLSISLQEKIYGISEQAMTGGVTKVGILTQPDVDMAQEKFSADLNEQIKNKLALDDIILDVKLIKGQILKSELSHQVGQKVENFNIVAQVLAQAVRVDFDEFLAKAQEKYKQKNISQAAILNWKIDEFDYSIQNLDLENKTALLNAILSANVASSFNVENFDKKEIAGFDKKGIEYYFAQYPSIKNVEIKFSPFWVKSAPALADRIEIIIQ